LDSIEAIVQKFGRGAVDGLLLASSKCIVLEAGREPWTGYRIQLVAGIPGVRGSPRGISQRGQIPIEVIGQALVTQRQLLVGGVLGGRTDRLRKACAGKRATHHNLYGFIIGMRRATKDGGSPFPNSRAEIYWR
jgi:hypothetical protein